MVAALTWLRFMGLFLEQFFPRVIQDAKRKEFIDLIQGNSSVIEFEAKFTALSRFAMEMVSTLHLKCKKFEEGLQISIRPLVVAQCHADYRRFLASVLAAEKERSWAEKIKDRNSLLRAGTASTVSQ